MKIEETFSPIIADIKAHPYAAVALLLFEAGHRCHRQEIWKYGEVQEAWDELHLAKGGKPIRDLHLRRERIPVILQKILQSNKAVELCREKVGIPPELFYRSVMECLQSLSKAENVLKQMLD